MRVKKCTFVPLAVMKSIAGMLEVFSRFEASKDLYVNEGNVSLRAYEKTRSNVRLVSGLLVRDAQRLCEEVLERATSNFRCKNRTGKQYSKA